MAPTVGDILRIICRLVQAANDVQNVYHGKVESGTPPTGATLASDMASFMDGIYNQINYGIADNIVYSSVAIYNLTQDEFYGDEPWPTLSIGGGGTNPMLPPQCAPLVLFQTATPGHLGKKFLPPITDNVLDDDGSLTAGYVTNTALLGADIVAGMSPGTYYVSFGIYSGNPAVYYPFSAAVARDFVATQRRRYTGKGS